MQRTVERCLLEEPDVIGSQVVEGDLDDHGSARRLRAAAVRGLLRRTRHQDVRIETRQEPGGSFSDATIR